MNISLFFKIYLENMPTLFAFILCYLPMGGSLRVPVRRIWQMGGILVLVFLPAASLIIAQTGVPSNVTLFPMLPVFFFFYQRTIKTTIYKALAVFLAAISLFSFCCLYMYIFSARMGFGSYYTDHSWPSSVFYFLFSLAFMSLLYYPASVHMKWLIENYHVSSMWKGGIVWAAIFSFITVFIIPKNYRVLQSDRFFYIYLLIVTLLLFCMLYMFCLLYRSARNNYDINKLERQNQFLGFQSKQYHMLTQHMEQTRRIRHDFRQQMVVIQNLAKAGQLDELNNYLAEYQAALPAEYVSLCANPAVNAIASYYDELCRESDIPVSWAVNLPQSLPLPEPEFCMMLGNLLENAIDAVRTLPAEERHIKVISHMASSAMLVLIVENTHNTIVRKKGEKFLSTKHSGEAIGLSSIKETVDCYHGDMLIDYDERRFTVNILLNL